MEETERSPDQFGVVNKSFRWEDEDQSTTVQDRHVSLPSKAPESSGPGPAQERAVRTYKLLQTVALVFCWVTMGFYSSIWATTLPDMRDRLSTTTETIALAAGSKRIGSMVGGLVGSVFNDRLHGKSMFFIAVSLMTAGVSKLIQPWSTYVEALGFLLFMEGVAQGTIDAVGNSFVMSLWGEKADPAMHAIHFGYPIGSIFSPILTASFISPDDEDPSNCTLNSISSTTCSPGSTLAPEDKFADNSQIEIPYTVVGIFTVAMSSVFWFLLWKSPPKGYKLDIPPKKNLCDVVDPASCARGKAWYGVTMVALMMLWAVSISVLQSPIGTFGFTYATESDLGFSKREASAFDMTLNIAGMAGRGLGIVVSHFVPIQLLLISEVGIIAASCTVIAFEGTDDKLIFWIFCALTMCLVNPAWPGLYAFMDKYIVLYSFVVALSQVGSGLTGFFLDWLLGYMYDNVSKESMYYMGAGIAILLLLIHIAMQVTASVYGTRFSNTDKLTIAESDTSSGVSREVNDDVYETHF